MQTRFKPCDMFRISVVCKSFLHLLNDNSYRMLTNYGLRLLLRYLCILVIYCEYHSISVNILPHNMNLKALRLNYTEEVRSSSFVE
uniref:F-box domain-containing protein n=1 Tax=Anguilla anguilla TaxID=7936 RepID=A0A0E9X669_ANGAN